MPMGSSAHVTTYWLVVCMVRSVESCSLQASACVHCLSLSIFRLKNHPPRRKAEFLMIRLPPPKWVKAVPERLPDWVMRLSLLSKTMEEPCNITTNSELKSLYRFQYCYDLPASVRCLGSSFPTDQLAKGKCSSHSTHS